MSGIHRPSLSSCSPRAAPRLRRPRRDPPHRLPPSSHHDNERPSPLTNGLFADHPLGNRRPSGPFHVVVRPAPRITVASPTFPPHRAATPDAPPPPKSAMLGATSVPSALPYENDCMNRFLEAGRIAFLQGEVWVDLSREQHFTHTAVKTDLTAVRGDRTTETCEPMTVEQVTVVSLQLSAISRFRECRTTPTGEGRQSGRATLRLRTLPKLPRCSPRPDESDCVAPSETRPRCRVRRQPVLRFRPQRVHVVRDDQQAVGLGKG